MFKNDFVSRFVMTLFMCFLCIVVSCSGNEDTPEISVNGEVTIEANGTVSGDIVVTAEHTDWTVEVNTGKEWLTAYKNGNKVALSAKENQSLENRIAIIEIAATADSKLTRMINITQKGAGASILVNGSENTDITFHGTFDNKSGIDYRQTIKVKSNVNWSVSGKPDWLSVSPSNGNGDVDMNIYPTSENETSSPRSASIVLTGGGKSAAINVIQEAGKPICYVEIQNQVILYDRMCWEYNATDNVNTFQWILLSESEYKRLTNKEIIEILGNQEKLKYTDQYVSFVSRDYNDDPILSNSTYYIMTIATNEFGEAGELVRCKVVTPGYKNATEDAWVDFENAYANQAKGFWFDVRKEGYCSTYNLIYGILPSDYTYNSAVYAFEINYYLKYKKKHWYAEEWDMEIVTDYPNNHTFTYYTYYLPDYPLCFAYGWGVFKDGSLSSDLTGFTWDTSEEENVIRKIQSNSKKMQNVLIRRSEEKKRAKSMHK